MGNMVIDAMQYTVVENYSHPELEWVGDSRFVVCWTSIRM